jgi:glutamine synthetase
MRTLAEIKELCQREGIRFVDLKALDLVGHLHHLTLPVDQFNESVMKDGVGFDGSSYGFAKTENSDMVLIPDLDSANLDPFREAPTLSMFCGIHLADDERTRFPQDIRFVARKAEDLLKELDIADGSRWAPEFEFNLFDEVEYRVSPEESSFMIYTSDLGDGNAYHACNPRDRFADFRDRAVELLKSQGISIRYHHHEVGASGQQEIETNFAPLVQTCDAATTIRYILKNQAAADGLAVTFMPKPIFKQAGNGWHVHQFLVRNGVNIFYQPGEYGNLSKTARHYIGGVLLHGPALCAITNPSTNSYKRLVPGYEAPVALTYGKANRAGALRIPAYVNDPALVRIEYRPPDATSNPYLCLAAILLAGIDGIERGIDPADHDFGPYDGVDPNAPELRDRVKSLPTCLDEALDALGKDHEFLLRKGVFNIGLIDRWISIKRKEILEYSLRPHPYEFELYFEF